MARNGGPHSGQQEPATGLRVAVNATTTGEWVSKLLAWPPGTSGAAKVSEAQGSQQRGHRSQAVGRVTPNCPAMASG